MVADESGVLAPESRTPTRPNRPHIRRPHSVLYTDAEWAHLQAIARLCGRTRSDFIRDVSLRRRVQVKPWVANADLVRELAACGMALTHLAATARASAALPVAADVDRLLAELRALIRRIAGTPNGSGTRC